MPRRARAIILDEFRVKCITLTRACLLYSAIAFVFTLNLHSSRLTFLLSVSMKHFPFLNCLALCLAQDFGDFLLQSQLTTFANTLVDQTIYILPSDDTGTSLTFSSTTLQSIGPTSDPIVSDTPTSSSPSSAHPSYYSPSPASSIATSWSPSPIATTTSPAPSSISSSSPPSLTILSPSLTAPSITTSAPVTSSLSEVSSTSSGCSAFEITQFFTEEQTSYSTHLTTQIVEVTVTSRYYPNTTSSSLPADSTTSFTSTNPSSAAFPSPVESLCGNAATTITRTVYKVEYVQSILFDVALPPLYASYETSVNGTPVLHIHQLASQTPVWPYHYNGFPIDIMTASNQPIHQIVPSHLTTGSYDLVTAFSTNPPVAQATSAYSNGASSLATSPGGPPISLVAEAGLLSIAPLSAHIDFSQSDTASLINFPEISLAFFSIKTPSTSSLIGTSSAQPVNVFTSTAALPTALSNSASYHLSTLSNIGGESPTSTAVASYATGWPIPALSSARTVQLSHSSIIANLSTYSSTNNFSIPTPSYASVSSVAYSSSTSSLFGGYDCTDVNGNDDNLLLCKKNGQSRAKPMPSGMQIILYSFVLLFLNM